MIFQKTSILPIIQLPTRYKVQITFIKNMWVLPTYVIVVFFLSFKYFLFFYLINIFNYLEPEFDLDIATTNNASRHKAVSVFSTKKNVCRIKTNRCWKLRI